LIKRLYPARLLFPVIIPVFLIWACTGSKEGWQGTIEEVDGAVVVHNPKAPIHPGLILELKEDLRIGEAEGAEEYMFTNIRDLAVDDDGNIYAADYEDVCIKVYDGSGVFLRRISQKGQGPGELGRPYGVQITDNAEVMVHDGANRRVHYFSRHGDFLRDVDFGKLWHLTCRSDGREFYYAMVMLRGEDFSGFKLMQLDSELNEKRTFFEWPMPYEPNLPYRIYPPGLSFGILPDGSLVLGWSETYELKIHNPDGSLRTHILRDYDLVPMTAADKDRIKQQIAESPNELMPQREPVFPDRYPAYQDFLPDDQGRIIVQTYEKGDNDTDYIFEVFDPEGKYLGCFLFHILPSVWKRDKVYTIEEDEDGFHIIKRYAVTWLLPDGGQ
jgi:hypothetical protein